VSGQAPDEPAGQDLPVYYCERCNHEWVPRKTIRPAVCPACKDPRWDRPRTYPQRKRRTR